MQLMIWTAAGRFERLREIIASLLNVKFCEPFPMNTNLGKAVLLLSMVCSCVFGLSNVHAQLPSLQDLTRNVNEAASKLEEKQNSILGFKKLELPSAISNMVDIRFRKPTLPNLGLLDKLKNFGKPKLEAEAPTQGPILAGISKIFQPKETSTPGFLGRLLGNTSASGSSSSGQIAQEEIARLSSGLQQHVDRMSREAKSNATDLFSNLDTNSPQPPLRSARQYSGQTTSR